MQTGCEENAQLVVRVEPGVQEEVIFIIIYYCKPSVCMSIEGGLNKEDKMRNVSQSPCYFIDIICLFALYSDHS